jgi:endonuclease YncB( thermonuclease family)
MTKTTIIGVIIAIIVMSALAFAVFSIKCIPDPTPPFPIPPKPRPIPVPTPIVPVDPEDVVDDEEFGGEKYGKVVTVWGVNSITVIREDIRLPILRRKRFELYGIKPPTDKKHQEAAGKYLESLVLDKEVAYIRIDDTGVNTEADTVWLYSVDDPDLPMINLVVVKAGWAIATDAAFTKYEEEAKAAKIGMWAN